MAKVEADSPGAEVGIRTNDIILEIDQKPVKNVEEFNKRIKGYKAGETILFLVKRGRGALYLTLKVPEHN